MLCLQRLSLRSMRAAANARPDREPIGTALRRFKKLIERSGLQAARRRRLTGFDVR
jgi:hypothetical protein